MTTTDSKSSHQRRLEASKYSDMREIAISAMGMIEVHSEQYKLNLHKQPLFLWNKTHSVDTAR